MAKKRCRNPEEELVFIPASSMEGVIVNEETGQVSMVPKENPQHRRKANKKRNAKRKPVRKVNRRPKKKNTRKRNKRPARAKNGRFKRQR